MRQCVDLTTLPWNAGRGKSIWWEADRLQVTVLSNVERVAWLAGRSVDTVRDSI